MVSVERVMKELACATPAPPRVTSSGGTCAQKQANMSSPATASALHVKGWLQASERPSVQVQRSWNSCAHAARRRAQGRLASKRGKCKEKQVLKFILTKGSWKVRREMRGEADADDAEAKNADDAEAKTGDGERAYFMTPNTGLFLQMLGPISSYCALVCAAL